jgi:hypothetical protein
MNPIPCTICQEDGHKASKCPTLHSPLTPGFHQGGGGGGGHSHDDDDDEAIKCRPTVSTVSRIHTRQYWPQYLRSVTVAPHIG